MAVTRKLAAAVMGAVLFACGNAQAEISWPGGSPFSDNGTQQRSYVPRGYAPSWQGWAQRWRSAGSSTASGELAGNSETVPVAWVVG